MPSHDCFERVLSDVTALKVCEDLDVRGEVYLKVSCVKLSGETVPGITHA